MELCNSPFLYVLKAGIWGVLPDFPIPLSASDKEWENLLKQARAHSVEALIADGAGLLPAESRPSFQILASLALSMDAIERGNQRVYAVLKSMAAFWEKEGVSAVLLKGQGLAVMYTNPQHRTPGDIDWYLPGKENFRKALELVKSKGIAPEIDGDGDYHYSVNGVIVEHHRGWCDISSPFKRRLAVQIEKEFGYSREQDFTIPAPLTNLIQLNVHILKHILVMGIGWRQLCDLALATKHYQGQYSFEEYRQAISRLGLMRWTKLLYGILEKYLGTDCALIPVVPLEGRDVDRLAGMIMDCGNFGRESGKRMLGSYLTSAGFLCRYVPGEVLWRPISLVWNRFMQLFRRKR